MLARVVRALQTYNYIAEPFMCDGADSEMGGTGVSYNVRYNNGARSATRAENKLMKNYFVLVFFFFCPSAPFQPVLLFPAHPKPFETPKEH